MNPESSTPAPKKTKRRKPKTKQKQYDNAPSRANRKRTTPKIHREFKLKYRAQGRSWWSSACLLDLWPTALLHDKHLSDNQLDVLLEQSTYDDLQRWNGAFDQASAFSKEDIFVWYCFMSLAFDDEDKENMTLRKYLNRHRKNRKKVKTLQEDQE